MQSSVSNAYPPNTSCTLPRHPNHHWPTYGGTIAGVRHLPQMAVHAAPPPSTIAMQHLGPTSNRPRVCIGVPEDDVSADTPLMLKRESTV